MKTKKTIIKLAVILAIFGIIAAIVVFWVPNIKDYKKFPYFVIHNASPAYHFKYNIVPNLFKKAKYRYKKKLLVSDFEKFLVSTGTTAFIVIKNDTIIYEKYFNGYRRNSINKSFSIAKSFISALVGIAIDHGYIKSIDEPVIDYIPELRGKGFNSITIKHLLTMSSGIKHSKFDEFKSYITADLKKNILNAEIETEPGKYYHYKNYDPQLLGLILSRATKEKVATFLQEKLWKPLGMEYPASWSVDSNRGRFEKIESGINARAIDFAKFGRLF
jgi:CubicO group peptidase (beta-lactamase class C family)